MKDWWTDNDSGDEVNMTPGVATAVNNTTGDKVETVPTKVTITDHDNNVSVFKAKSIRIEDASGNYIELSIENGLVHHKATKELKASADDGVVITEEGKRTQLDILLLSHDDGAGKTNAVNEEQMVISADGKMGIYEASDLSLTEGSNEVTLDTDDVLQATIGSSTLSAKPSGVEVDDGDGDSAKIAPATGLTTTQGDNTAKLDATSMEIHQGDDFAKVSPAGGIDAQESGYKAKVSPSAGLHLEDNAGATVDAATKPDENIDLKDTSMCADDGSTNHAWVLRGEETPV